MSTVHQMAAAKEETKNDWETPDDFFRLLNYEFSFDVDVCATEENMKCEHYFKPEDDGLTYDWLHTWWCNPPFDNIAPWVAKARGETTRKPHLVGVMLLPANRSDQRWWHELVVPSIDEGICRIRWVPRRLKFKGASSTASFPCLLLIWGKK